MTRVCIGTFLLLASGCQDWPDPEIRAVSPSRMLASEYTPIELSADLPLPATVDYEQGTIDVSTAVKVEIGSLELATPTFTRKGVLATQVPTLFVPGSYDVRITLSDGRVATAPSAFTVTDGQWPDTYAIDPIGAQAPFVPFTITVRAQGPNAASFHGNVRFESGPGVNFGPKVSEPFVNGVLTQRVVFATSASSAVIVVTDVAGHRVSSNVFQLR
ncbi:hypothetical protein [Archangium sp.]|jgi:hypothetical protein|uniref:hypothetical protein n=1 Tax=Archangium sp. TaxID=1872627 RepID=UPI002EDB9AA3